MMGIRLEHVDRRICGALSLVDVSTEIRLLQPLKLKAKGLKWLRNRSGYYVILGGPGLEAFMEEDTFRQPPDEPAPESVPLTVMVEDPNREYLPQQCQIHLPRDPASNTAAKSLFHPVIVKMFAAPQAQPASSQAVLRLALMHDETEEMLPWALIRVTFDSPHFIEKGEEDEKEIEPQVVFGMADHRGEAVVPIPRLPLLTFSDDPDSDPASRETVVEIEVFCDQNLTTIPPADIHRAGVELNRGYVPNPQRMIAILKLDPNVEPIEPEETDKFVKADEVKAGSGKPDFRLRAGQTLHETLRVKFS